MIEVGKISEKQIEEHVGAQSFERGQKYFQAGRLFNPQRRGAEIKGECSGSEDNIYHIRVILSGKGIESSTCSCPIGTRCKHVAGLLLKWIAKSKDFIETPDHKKILLELTKEQLVDLALKMLRKNPDLETLVELSVPVGKNKPRGPSINIAVVQRQINSILRGAGSSWGAANNAADGLLAVFETADECIKRGDVFSAFEIAESIAQSILDEYEMFEDHDGDLISVISDCAEMMANCLDAGQDDFSFRERVLECLFDILLFDLDYGGIGVSDEIPDYFLQKSNSSEKDLLAGWVRKKIDSCGKSKDWERKALGSLLLDLEAEKLDPDAYIQICRNTGRIDDLIEKLLELKRFDEAIREAKAASDYELFNLTKVFATHGQPKAAFDLMLARSKTTKDQRINEWLRDYFKNTGDYSKAIELAFNEFSHNPTLSSFTEVKDVAVKSDSWPQYWEKMHEQLEKRKDFQLLTRIFLEEKKLDQAIAYFEKLGKKSPKSYFAWNDLEIELAQAAEKDRPEVSVKIYKKHVSNLIVQSGRSRYVSACEFIKRIGDLLNAMDHTHQWKDYLVELRIKNKRLRAFIEEMDKAKLKA
ncbi:MAG: SWIM zinc finger family protein [Candidatus Riflebacteria bacterium]|nr:SWIM zinc finger family protein [Candidatus Riflebacteria bacterium]